MKEYSFEVSEAENGKRLDIFLQQSAKDNDLGYSRTFIKDSISHGNCSVNGLPVVKAHHKVKTGDKLTIRLEDRQAVDLAAEELPLDILFEDGDIAVINKQPGLVVHPAPGNKEHTLVNALLYHFKDKLSSVNPMRPGIVHRLDKDTSGLIVIAKNNNSHFNLTKQFAEHLVQKKYIALVEGYVEFNEDVIELPIGRHPLKRQNMSVGFRETDKYAKTRYHTLLRNSQFSMLALFPLTGRTHQLRVHLAHIGHPILGDGKYGRKNTFPRLALHAQYLGFKHPGTEEFVEFYCKLPDEFTYFIEQNRVV
ncbi:MAG: RluA family pseudouridine synthase [Candidatus Omnitrophota bacterium]|jgi:23S rRNA pseudouridine1911/1915/1917 synthase|nr:MAG: RluA family pseudouridine synthase [Candidatus Omnitrophota bacterium]